MPKKLTIVVASIQAVGHVMSCAGALTAVRDRGHRVIFILTKIFKGKLAKLGYEEHIFAVPDDQSNQQMVNPGKVIAEAFLENNIFGRSTPKEKFLNMIDTFMSPHMIKEFKAFDQEVKQVVELYKPDLFYVDGNFMPAIYHSAIPWIRNISPQPLFNSFDDTLPPGGSGLPVDGDRSEWLSWKEARSQLLRPKGMNDFIEGLGYPPVSEDFEIVETQTLTVYAFPDELNYPQIRDSDWFNLEVFNILDKSKRVESLENLIPKEFLNDDLGGSFSGKLIYVSLGSMGSVDLELMKRLVGVLAKSNHKYIISTGPRHAEYKLTGPNMWGSEYLPQTQIVPHVDLVITHGGNNTVTEVFAEGKPMVVLPLFGDQYDNAQRLKETRLGARIDTYDFTESDLLDTIERLLNNLELQQKLNQASKRILATKHHEELADKIEELTKKFISIP